MAKNIDSTISLKTNHGLTGAAAIWAWDEYRRHRTPNAGHPADRSCTKNDVLNGHSTSLATPEHRCNDTKPCRVGRRQGKLLVWRDLFEAGLGDLGGPFQPR